LLFGFWHLSFKAERFVDRDVIYLDNDDEITSVVDKLKGSDFASIDLVIPKEALVLKSVVNLKLLKRQAESLGKEITVVTQDKVGKKLAEQIGIPVIDKPGDQPKEVHMAEGDDTKKAAAAGAVAGVAAAGAAEAAIEMKEAAKPVAAAEESDGIEFKPEASPLEETAEVVTPTAKGEKKSDPSTTSTGSAPGAAQGAGKPANKKWWKFGWKTWAIIGGFAALAVFVLGYIFVPLANVEVTLAAQKKSVDFSFTVDKTYTSVDTTAQTMPGKLVTVEASKSQEYTATGKKDAGTKASGTVTIHNHNYSTDPFAINAGARIVTAGGLVFLTNSNVTVPKYTKVGAVITDGTVDVAVTASAPGEQYNVAGGTMSIPGLGSSTADIYASSGANFSGGTTKKITYVTQTDVNTAKEDMAKQVETELVSEANKKAGTDVRLIDKAYKITQISATASPDVNGEGDKFTLTAKAKIDALVFTEADLTKLATAVLGDQIGSGKEIVDKSSLTSAAELESGDFDKGTMKVKISGEAYVAAKLAEDKIKTDISGEPNQKAIDYLKGLDGVSDAKITNQFPPFLKRLPRIKSHIYLKPVLDKTQ
jgi:hypothetical protein